MQLYDEAGFCAVRCNVLLVCHDAAQYSAECAVSCNATHCNARCSEVCCEVWRI